MSEFEQLLLSNSGEDAFDVAVKLLAVKLADEFAESEGKASRLRSDSALQDQTVQELYAEALQRWPAIDDGGSREVPLPLPQLQRCMRPLMNLRLRQSDLRALDDTLEHLVARSSKGALGQYFTPREVIAMCVEALAPTTGELVIDPACGSGGFLFEAVSRTEKANQEPPRCLGIDFSPKSARVATLLAAATFPDDILVTKANSLDGREYVKQSPALWQEFLTQEAASNTQKARNWGAWNKLGCDVLLANPPFAGDIDDFDLLSAYESQIGPGGKRSVSREHLFLERAVDLLRPGGRLAIVLPQGILANSTASYLRDWVLSRCRVLAVVSLDSSAFLPHTAVKTAVLFLEKPADAAKLKEEYRVLFSASRDSGKDRRGRTVGAGDYLNITAALQQFFEAEGKSWAQRGVRLAEPAPAEAVSIEEVRASGRFDPEHYDPIARRLERTLTTSGAPKLGQFVLRSVPRFKPASTESFEYVDISAVDRRTGQVFPEETMSDGAPSRATYLVQPGDVLVSTVRPERNVVALVTEQGDKPLVASSGFCVLRPIDDVDPEALYAFCKTELFWRILSMHSTASMYPTVGEKDVLNVPVPPGLFGGKQKISSEIRAGLEMIRKGQHAIAAAVQEMDAAVVKAQDGDSATWK